MNYHAFALNPPLAQRFYGERNFSGCGIIGMLLRPAVNKSTATMNRKRKQNQSDEKQQNIGEFFAPMVKRRSKVIL